jgi:hypothetical protein
MVKALMVLEAQVVTPPLVVVADQAVELVAMQLMVPLALLQLVVTAAAVLTHFMGMVWVVAVQCE